MSSLSGHGSVSSVSSVSFADPAASPAVLACPSSDAAAHWTGCHGLTSGLPSAPAAEPPPRWPDGLPQPFDARPGADLAACDALARPGELRALGVSVVPCVVLAGGRPPLAVPVPAGTSWHQACHTLVAKACWEMLPGGRHGPADEVAHAVSHNLRGPLLGAADLINLALDSPEIGAIERQVLQQAALAVLTAAQRLEALRQFLHLDRDPPAPQRVDASALLMALATELETVWPHPKRRFDVAPGLHLHADRGQLELVLRQLLDNAFKFSHRVDAPEISVALHHVPGYAVLAIADNGPGFSASHAGRLFGLFQRIHLASEFPGLGAGLALVRRMAERHGGWAWADLGTPGCTVFLLALPEA